MKGLANQLKKKSMESGHMDFQGFKIVANHRGKTIVNSSVGKTYPFYDIASLTKIVFTTPWFMRAVENKKLKLEESVQSHLPWYPHKKVKIQELLNHSAGNKWWSPFYLMISDDLVGTQAYQQLLKMVQQAPLSRGAKAVYSDIDFYLLGALMEKIDQAPLQEIWNELKSDIYPRSQFHFNFNQSLEKPSRSYAPTEKCVWRKRVIRGHVHDENAFAIGGVAPHAGLFGRIEDLRIYGDFIRQSWLGKGPIKGITLRKFAKRSISATRGDWGYGFMIPSKGKSSAGTHFSRSSFGHTGFTGTSFWFDPTRDLYVALLSNRVHPSRDSTGFQQLRPKLHDWIVAAIEES